ncbi:deoxyguanosinetriphosphate triphosphohydrolase [Priestia megaterium]|uniref:deoxyguanosinetriphosphate triphosphohydrolase n=1 Tax=Priestia megaterium TaxID=1404 RepID=UPI00207690B6|nr:deoxyguanosinetriphosphate triphosphohydrolase [Priestia megaterium]USD19477.1 deoxyguanosinetriphosphate triphosphohydrolase [Priestia megaterium]
MKEYKLTWKQLLCEDRERTSSAEKAPHRNGFDMDYDRIISSSSLRRLQDKAQVFPLQENDFTRTRLTHSLEVSALGRSFGQRISQWLIEQKEINSPEDARKIPSLLSVACLVHDLGNPPFGHYGEDIIRKWFKGWFDSQKFNKLASDYKEKYQKEIITEEQKKDFIYFEGNAQSIRILSRLQFLNDKYGINFTFGTLATLIKYPWASSSSQAAVKKKFGYFSSESDLFELIRGKTGLFEECRHPLTYILEAADDIAYLAADVEDGVKKQAIPWEKVYNKAKEILGDSYHQGFEYLDNLRKQALLNEVPNVELVNVQNFKVWAQGIMFNAACDTFFENYPEIMNGTFSGDLLSNSRAADISKFLTDVAFEFCYTNEEVLTLELVGDRVLESLMELFVNAIVEDNGEFKTKTKNGKLFNLISSNFRHIQKLDESGLPKRKYEDMSLYDKLILITDFISGMTDSYAVNLHQKLSGVKLP